MKRKIGEITAQKTGVLLIVLAQIHGNEPAGTEAIQKAFALLEGGLRGQDVSFRGKVVGLVGNIPASTAGVRFLSEDLNRMWTPKRLDHIRGMDQADLHAEEQEMLALDEAIGRETRNYDPSELFLLDLHTTTAKGGTFTIPIDKAASHQVAQHLGSPIIHGFCQNMKGTLMDFASQNPWGVETSCVAFEAGQHESPQAIQRGMSAILNAMVALDMLDKRFFATAAEEESSPSFPLNSKIVYRHRLKEGDGFVMKPGYRNFMPIQLGEELARDKNGPIRSPYAGFILMPLYQKQGEDGFFIVVEA